MVTTVQTRTTIDTKGFGLWRGRRGAHARAGEALIDRVARHTVCAWRGERKYKRVAVREREIDTG